MSDAGDMGGAEGTGGASHYELEAPDNPDLWARRTNQYFGLTQVDDSAAELRVRYGAQGGAVRDDFAIRKETVDGESRPSQVQGPLTARVRFPHVQGEVRLPHVSARVRRPCRPGLDPVPLPSRVRPQRSGDLEYLCIAGRTGMRLLP